MTTRLYTHRDKKDRNQRLYEFWLAHQSWSIESIAHVFHISQPRATQILNEMKKSKTNGDAGNQPTPEAL